MMNKLLIFFAAGCVGALANSIAVWALGDFGITRMMGVSMAPALSPAWLYPRIVWGGIWGTVFILPFHQSALITKGLILSFLPTLVQLFFIFPQKMHVGVAGFELGLLTPLFVVIFNIVWGVVTGATIKLSR